MPNQTSVTLQQLIALALPAETRVLASHHRLHQLVTWVVVTVLDNDALSLNPGDLVFLLPPYADDPADRVVQIAQSGVAGVVIFGEPPPEIARSAEQAELPLLALPLTADLRQIERAALSLIVDRSAGPEQRAAQLFHKLTVLSAENAGLGGMAALIGETTNRIVLIQDKRLNPLAVWQPAEDETLRAALIAWASAPANLPEAFRDRRRAAQQQSIAEQALPLDRLVRWIVPIVAKGMARGYLSLIATHGDFAAFDRSVIHRSAAACALEMAKTKAISEAEKRVRGSFVDALLAGSLSPVEAARWARSHKYDAEGAHAAIVADWTKPTHPSYRRLETLIHGVLPQFHVGVLVYARDTEVVLLCRLDPRTGIETARRVAAALQRQATIEFPNDPISLGIGKATSTLLALRESYREAANALSMARRLAAANPLYFGELNVYRLLFQLEASPELALFCDEILGALVEYDRAEHTDLIKTLTEYFAHNSNLSQTAEALFIHRNTLLYRMERIKEISKLDLDDPETRLSMQLALRAHRLVTAHE